MNIRGVTSTFSLFVLSMALVYAQSIDLPTSKQLIGEIPGHPQRLNSLPMSMAVSPDGRYVVTVNAGYGTYESQYEQSLAVLDTQTGTVADFPDDRTPARQAKQTLYSGLAFDHDGSRLYASMGSLTDPSGEKKGDTGNGIVVYSFTAGKIAPERFIPLPLQQLAPGHKTHLIGQRDGDKGIPFPGRDCRGGRARIGETAGGRQSFRRCAARRPGQRARSTTALTCRKATRCRRTYPIALAIAPDGQHAYVALWNASEIVELDLAHGTIGRKLALLKPTERGRSRHPSMRISNSRPTARRSTLRLPTGMPSPRSTSPLASLP